MNSAITVVREKFKTDINTIGAIGGFACYDYDKKTNEYPHCIIGAISEVEGGDQGEFGQTVTVNINVVNSWGSDYGDRTAGETIINSITTKFLKKPVAFTLTGFKVCVLVLDNMFSFTEQNQARTVHTTTMRFKLELFET